MKKNDNKPKKEKATHAGHRKRLQTSVTNDPEFETLSDFQTLEYLLCYFIPRKDVNPMAHELIDRFGTLYNVFMASPEELYAIKGVTHKVSNFFPNLFSVVRRAEYSRRDRGARINNVSDGVEILRPHFLGRNNEHLYLMMLDINDRVIGINCISRGRAHVTEMDIETIVSRVTRAHASKVMIAHNHPAGSRMPSFQDVSATESLNLTLNAMDKTLLDHIIFSDEDYFSFHERDLINDIKRKTDAICGTETHESSSRRFYANIYFSEENRQNVDEKDISGDGQNSEKSEKSEQ